jgi:hypothetical protein
MFRSFLDHHQVHKELEYATCTLYISALCGPDNGQGMAEICCPDEFI